MSLITSLIGGSSGTGGGTSGPGKSDDAPGQNKDETGGSQQTGGNDTNDQTGTGNATGAGGASGETSQSGNRIPPIRESIAITGSSPSRAGADGATVDDQVRLDAAFSPVLSEDQARQLAEAARSRTEQQSILDRVAEVEKGASQRFEAGVDEVREASEPPADTRLNRAA